MLNLIQLVTKKLQKGKSLEQIADEVEESFDVVEKICNTIKSCDTGDVNAIYEKVKEL